MTEVKVPTLGESITEATLGAWLKQAIDTMSAEERRNDLFIITLSNLR